MPAAKKAAKKKKVVILPTAEAVMHDYNLSFDDESMEFIAEPPPEPDSFSFFSEDTPAFEHSCAVIEIGGFHMPEGPFSQEELMVLFKHAVTQALERASRKQAIATLTQNQKQFEPFLKFAGFIPAGTSINPSSGNSVTIWVLNT